MMSVIKNLLNEIDNCYADVTRARNNLRALKENKIDVDQRYEILKDSHLRIIKKYDHLWINVTDLLPKENERVFAIEDLSTIGKGIFISDYYYRSKWGFVANVHDEDGYGFITKWFSFKDLDENFQ